MIVATVAPGEVVNVTGESDLATAVGASDIGAATEFEEVPVGVPAAAVNTPNIIYSDTEQTQFQFRQREGTVFTAVNKLNICNGYY